MKVFFVVTDVIQKNLEPLRENIEKKKRAQDAYYENNTNNFGISPLRRDGRRSVKQRLGRSNVPYTGTNTSFLPPKQRLRKINNTLNNKINTRKTRINLAQQRLYRIRARQQDTMNTMTQPGKKIRIRRPYPLNMGEPKNFQVEVVNNTANVPDRYYPMERPRQRRFRQILNAAIQMEIRKLQLQFTGSNVPPSEIKPAFTLKTLNDRFANLK